jgi:hypothetical protein
VSIPGKEDMTAGRETKRARAPWIAPVWKGEEEDGEDDGTRGPCLYMTSGTEWRRWRKDGEDEETTNGSSMLVLEGWSSPLSRKGVLW